MPKQTDSPKNQSPSRRKRIMVVQKKTDEEIIKESYEQMMAYLDVIDR